LEIFQADICYSFNVLKPHQTQHVKCERGPHHGLFSKCYICVAIDDAEPRDEL